MNSLIDTSRPPAFCPGCSHERVVTALDVAICQMNLSGDQVVIVSDIGCSGLIDTFFKTHAFHGLHGRALTYATGLKLANPELTVIVTMGDGGIGIGAAHLLSACRKNLDLTLLILNNFNIGMTGGQFSATTPSHATTASGFLNQLEIPIDICHVAASAGAPYVARCSCFQKDLSKQIEKAIRFNGFSVLDIRGVCTGRYTIHNRLTPDSIQADMNALPKYSGKVEVNQRREYGSYYRELALQQPQVNIPEPVIQAFDPITTGRKEIIILGSAGQKIVTAGEVLCTAGMTAGLHVSLKTEYNITVLRGPSISEIILASEEIDFTGISKPDIIIALSQEGIQRRLNLFHHLAPDAYIIQATHVTVPEHKGKTYRINYKSKRTKSSDMAFVAIICLARLNIIISPDMLKKAFEIRLKDRALYQAMELFYEWINDAFEML